jgi:hypothetical protein
VTSTKFKRLTRYHRLQITRESEIVADLLRFKRKIRYRDARLGKWHSKTAKAVKDDGASENYVHHTTKLWKLYDPEFKKVLHWSHVEFDEDVNCYISCPTMIDDGIDPFGLPTREPIHPNTTSQNQLKKAREAEHCQLLVALPHHWQLAVSRQRTQREQVTLLRGLGKPEAQIILLRGLRKPEAQIIPLRGLRKPEAQIILLRWLRKPEAQIILLRGLRKPEAQIILLRWLRKPEAQIILLRGLKRPESQVH